MAVEVNMPRLGIMMDSGTITEWHVKEGDTVTKGAPILDFETSKLVHTIEAPADGVVIKTCCEVGDEIECGGIVAWVGEAGETVGDAAPAPAEAAPAPSAAPSAEATPAPSAAPSVEGGIEVNMPRLGIMMDSGTITTIHVKVGDTVAKGAPIMDFETSKLVHTIEAPADGTVSAICCAEGDEIECGGVVAMIGGAASAAPSAAPAAAEAPKAEAPADGKRVSKVVPLIGPRKVIGKRMKDSLANQPQGTTTCKIDITNLLAYKKKMADAGKKYTITDFFIKACAQALVEHPILNSAAIDDKIYTYESVNIGVAVALDGNLLVPVVKEAQDKSLDAISGEMKSMISDAREGKIDMNMLKDSTFSITSMGIYNVDYCTPFLNPPEAAILGIGKYRKEPVWDDKKQEFVPRDMCPLSLTSDHTVLDGGPAARFMETVGEILSDPEKNFK